MTSRRAVAAGFACVALLVATSVPAAAVWGSVGDDEAVVGHIFKRYRQYRSWKSHKNPLVD